MYLMVDKEKGEVVEGEGPRTKEILQEHAPPVTYILSWAPFSKRLIQ